MLVFFLDLVYLTMHLLFFLPIRIKKQKMFSQKQYNLIAILIQENELTLLNFNRLTHALSYKNTQLVTSDGDLLLTVDSLITLNNITGSNNLQLRSVNVKPAFYNKQYLDFSEIEFELYKLVDQFNDRYITNRAFYTRFLNEIHPFLDGNGRTCKILFEHRL